MPGPGTRNIKGMAHKLRTNSGSAGGGQNTDPADFGSIAFPQDSRRSNRRPAVESQKMRRPVVEIVNFVLGRNSLLCDKHRHSEIQTGLSVLRVDGLSDHEK